MKHLITILFILLATIGLYGQTELSLYNLNYSVPQAGMYNPAFYSYHKVVVGFPGLSSTRVGLNFDQLSFNNLFTQQADNFYQLDYDKISKNLSKQNYLTFNADLQLFYLGLNLKKSHFSLSVNEKVSSLFTYSDKVMQVAIYGNGDDDLLGEKIDFSKLGLNQIAYHEIALGYARDINEKLTVGIKAKYLAGIANVEVKDIEGHTVTTEEQIHIEHSGFSVNTTGYAFIDDDEDREIDELLMNTLPLKNKNTGFAFDIGANYHINDKMSVSASINDLGFINWKEETKQIVFNPVNYDFKGFEILKIIDEGTSDDYIEEEVDSLENLFKSEEVDGIAYKSNLSAKAYLAFDYAILPSHHVGVIANSMFFDGKMQTAYGAYYNFQPKRIFNATVNAAMRNGKLSLLGVGASLELGALQIYGTTEALTSLIKPDNASFVDARFGINLVFGKGRKRKERKSNAPQQIAPVNYREPATEEIKEELEIIDAPVEIKEIKEAPTAQPQVNDAPVVVSHGTHKNEIPVGYFVVVGAFEDKINAEKYSRQLKRAGYKNDYGFLTEKNYYYVYVYENIGDIEKARKIRNEYRTKSLFQFPNAWLLSVVKENKNSI